MIKIKILEQLEKIDKSIYWLAKETGISQNSMGKIVKGETTAIRYDSLDAICRVLKCQTVDIIEYIED